ncbi:hypothetical protein AW27_013695 [Streptomyces sp. PCS3-D2]|uniref:hypothetical protein n=1 Tax=Streptomyces sp. PCS3-D2 TaxID=1460244 RepID=UPI0004469D4D|nr:hypothetical protein [Streptomyces sp. PCS3-D2]WKV72484.1 hypothetical protein AW27_013695 [Streptomyces sp. PCS3-D2]
MTSIHRLALLKAAIAVGALRVAPGAPGAIGDSMERAATGTLVPMRPASRGAPERPVRVPLHSRWSDVA